MDPTLAAFLRSWPTAWWTVALCAVTAAIYGRGWRMLVRRGSSHFNRRHLTAFLAGLAALLLAVASPLEPFASLLLSVHMAQHLLLVFVAPLLIWAAAPQLPLMNGIPAPVLEHWILPLIQQRTVRAVVHFLTHPTTAWTFAAVVLWLWHIPRYYELALASEHWHVVEHACFFLSGLLFWWPVVQPYPSRPVWPRLAVIPYLFLAAVQATGLCAFLTFADRVLYPHYDAVPRIAGMSALTDQAVAGIMMWLVGLVVYSAPLVYLGWNFLYGRSSSVAEVRPADRDFPQPRYDHADGAVGSAAYDRWLVASTRVGPVATQYIARAGSGAKAEDFSFAAGGLTVLARSPAAFAIAPVAYGDFLRFPLLGAVLTWPVTRRMAQAFLLLIALAVVVDGFAGVAVPELNLAGVLPWVHWRGLVVLTLLIGGNVFCFACPFTLPRAVARRWMTPARDWPAALRSKWLAAGLLVVFFAAYEVFDLWSLPWWTAAIVVGYFALAFAVDVTFRGASFCKYVCPIGQFQFVQSLVSPWEVRVRDADRCMTCRTKECIRGSATARGCEMQLNVPRKVDNLDCTFCLDCVRACPHDNVGLLPAAPLGQLFHLGRRTGRAASEPRPDVAILMLVLVFAAFANAGGMIAPTFALENRLAAAWSWPIQSVETLYVVCALGLVPALALWGTVAIARRLDRERRSWQETVSQAAVALVPLGAAMWLAHYGFHLAIAATGFVPAIARFLGDWGIRTVSIDRVVARCCAIPPPTWLLRAEILALDFGLLASLLLFYRLALPSDDLRKLRRSFLPWALLTLALFFCGVWILLQPMEMRGALPGGSDAWRAGG